ncbi:MAG: hypothetical protein KIT09_13190 [Bryobacteraceae bacterium]|nr:hypothetical protein [Bryobacteraceae bacterium]
MTFSDFQPSGEYGYGCKAWIAHELEREYLGGSYYCWFSSELNPISPTGESSNPLEIYRAVDHAVKTGDENHSKIKDLRANIIIAINLHIARRDPKLARQVRGALRRAPLSMFRPQIWRIEMSTLEGRMEPGEPGWKEYLIRDLRSGEFEIIVE